jgi:catechol 2,3-dioxygenase-like lactoylglutathione lyase family enzyme
MSYQYTGYLTFLGAEQLDTARWFYEEVLGFPLLADEMGSLIFDMGGIRLRISMVENFQPQSFTVLGWHVDDIEQAAAHLAQAGIQPIRYAFLPHDDLGIATTGSDRVLWFSDPSGNLLSFTQA